MELLAALGSASFSKSNFMAWGDPAVAAYISGVTPRLRLKVLFSGQ